MSLLEQIRSDLGKAVKSGESLMAETLRGLLASAHNYEIEKRTKGENPELSSEDIETVLRKEAKKRREAIDIYGRAGREGLKKKEMDELEVIESYLPPPIGEEEIVEIVGRVIEEVGDENFGKVMQAVMKEVSGRAEAKLVGEIIKKELGE